MNFKGKGVLKTDSQCDSNVGVLPSPTDNGFDFSSIRVADYNYSTESHENHGNEEGSDEDTTIGEKDDRDKDNTLSGASQNFSYDDIIKMEFQSLEKAENFYMSYARQVGFAIRRKTSKRNASGDFTMCLFVCQKEGQRLKKWLEMENRRRKPRPDFRSNCQALFEVNFERSRSIWIVKKLVIEHNHDMVNPECVRFLKSHRRLKKGTKAEINSLGIGGVQTNQIVDMLSVELGGSCTQNDVYNYVQAARQDEMLDNDMYALIGYLSGKKNSDPSFYFDYNINDKKQLGNLFWTDSISRLDYSYFGDVVAFDSTYKCNVYNRLLVMLVGVNHHHQIIVFGCAMLTEECIDNYIWMLKQLLSAMGGKKPLSVVTDGDMSMRAAIREVLPQSCHRLCMWHLKRNVNSRMQNPQFFTDFVRCMSEKMEVNQFEHSWHEILEKYQLHNDEWMERMYVDRHMWAEVYLKERFLGGVLTTSRCKDIHSYIDPLIKKKLNLVEFINEFDLAIGRIRENEAYQDHLSTYTTPKIVHVLRAYEKQAADIYTLKSFERFQIELREEAAYVTSVPVMLNGDVHTHFVVKWNASDEVCTVTYNSRLNTISCSCKMLESMGFPCRHSIHVMKLERLKQIPDSCFYARWTKNVKHHSFVDHNSGMFPNELLNEIRYGALFTKFRSLCLIACKHHETYMYVSNEITRWTQHVKELNRNASSLLPNDPCAPK